MSEISEGRFWEEEFCRLYPIWALPCKTAARQILSAAKLIWGPQIGCNVAPIQDNFIFVDSARAWLIRDICACVWHVMCKLDKIWTHLTCNTSHVTFGRSIPWIILTSCLALVFFLLYINCIWTLTGVFIHQCSIYIVQLSESVMSRPPSVSPWERERAVIRNDARLKVGHI